jgi:two-component system nitrate/nitrite response regulator NarL
VSRETPLRPILVDDCVELRELLRELLTLRGCDVVGEAANGQEALELLEEVDCDVVVVDVNMPVMDGRETTAAIRRLHPGVEVVAFTVGDDAADALDLLRLGASAHFSKLDVDGLVDYLAGAPGERPAA